MLKAKPSIRVKTSIQLVSLISGLFFGIGMALSGMTNPASVIGFLDVMGYWDASLAFVMGGALAVFMPIYHFMIKPRNQSLSGESLCLANKKKIDGKLMLGATLFGIGWGLAGICPGPAIASLSFGNADILIFIMAMMIGSLMAKYMQIPNKQAVSQS